MDWQQRHIPIPAGLHELRWVYEKDFSGSKGLDTAWVDTLSFAPVSETFNPALDTLGLVWNTDGDASWFQQEIITFDGEDALQSGNISDGEETWAETTVLGPGTLAFWWRVESEPENDTLGFYFDDELIEEISGNSGWQRKSYSFGKGAHNLRWRYAKNASISKGLDGGWLDQVVYVGAVRPFDAWRAEHFTASELNDDMISGNFADADNDGVANILEYAVGQNPRLSDRFGLPTVAAIDVNGLNYLTLTYQRNKLATDIIYSIEVSSDLIEWDSSSTATRRSRCDKSR